MSKIESAKFSILFHIAAAMIGLGVFSYDAIPSLQSVDPASSSTAALAYLFIPLVAALHALIAVGVFYALPFSIRAHRSGRRSAAVLLFAAFVLGLLALVTESVLRAKDEAASADEIEQVRSLIKALPLRGADLSVPQQHEILTAYESLPASNRYRALLPNALVQRWDLAPEVITRLAEQQDPVLYSSLPGPADLTFGNRRRIAVIRLLAQHPHTSQKTLHSLIDQTLGEIGDGVNLSNEDREYVLGSILRSVREEDSMRAVLDRFPDSWSIASALSINPHTPVDLLRHISGFDEAGYENIADRAQTELVKRAKLESTCSARGASGDEVRALEKCWSLGLPTRSALLAEMAAQHQHVISLGLVVVVPQSDPPYSISAAPVSQRAWSNYCETTRRCPKPIQRKGNKPVLGLAQDAQQAYAQYLQFRFRSVRKQPIVVRLARAEEISRAVSAGAIERADDGFRVLIPLDFGHWPDAFN